MLNTLAMDNKRMKGTGQAIPASVPASIKGWDQISSLADMPPDHAVVMNNFIPRPGYLEVRRGSQTWATGLGGGTTPVETVMGYNAPSGGNSKLFGVANGTIYDGTAGGAATPTTITTLSTSRLQFTTMTNAGTTNLICCNGLDTPVYYNGVAWQQMALTGIAPSDCVHVTTWKGRVWFTLVNSTQSAYLDIGAVAGAATVFDVGPFFSRGGYLNAIGTWTIDTNQTVDEYIAFISSRGQVVVYQGTDPTTADTFALVGTYDLGTPIGRRCFLRISGNLWVICVDGVIPMTEMLVQAMDRAAAAKVAPTTMIMNAILQSAQQYKNNFGWQFIEYAHSQLAILNIPQAENQTAVQYVMNTLTGAWCQFLGLESNCWEVQNDIPYFGDNAGNIWQFDVGSGDGDTDITATVQTAFNYFETRGHLKQFVMIRPILSTDGSVTPGVGLNIDFGTGAPISIPSQIPNTGAMWDVAVWDVDVWPVSTSYVANWTTVEGIGQCASIITQLTTSANGSANGVTLQLNSWDILMQPCAGFF